MLPYRSIIFLPGHKPDWIEKAVASGADAIVLDLEDAVPADFKVPARDVVAASIARVRETNGEVGLFVRPNSLATKLTGGDMEAAVVPGLTGIFAPKIERAEDVIRYDALVDHFEAKAGIGAGEIELFVPVEMLGAIQRCEEIAAATPRVGAMIGPTAEHADIARAVGFEWTPEGLETLHLRSRILLACRSAGIHPVTGLWERVEDLEGLAEFCRFGRRLGFRGQIAIHPSHVPVINAAYTPSDEEIGFYRGLVEAYEEGERAGHGAVVFRGRHIDKAHLDKARDWLAMAERVTGLDGKND